MASTPIFKQKPPPKPPRMKSNLPSPTYEIPSPTYDLPIRLFEGGRRAPLVDEDRSSLSEVTAAYDASIASQLAAGDVVLKPSSPQIVRQKIYQVNLYSFPYGMFHDPLIITSNLNSFFIIQFILRSVSSE